MQIAAGQFKAKCLKIMDKVHHTREEVTITKRGKPVARLVPVEETPAKALFGFLRGSVVIKGDIVESTGEIWDAEADRA
ncbi:MAG: type II toxin-antitoxin system prevent-host-death family antitoxin [Candidatus Latescibacteria bacterium]|nr:type II toxin-antitoxin system prevent-host-death family antitoxin [Candidatus Latescibacterota bacterium]